VAYVPGAPTPSVLAVGPLGADYSTDEGQTWTRLAIEGLHAFSFSPTGARGWGVGEDGRIAKLDGKWDQAPFP